MCRQNWTDSIIECIKNAEPGNIIIVSSAAQKSLAERAISRMRPDIKLPVEIRPSDTIHLGRESQYEQK
jgi:hypothetical protein